MTKWSCVKILYQKFIQLFIVFYPNPYFTLYDECFCFTHIFFQWYWNWSSIFFPNDILSVFCLLGYHAEFPLNFYVFTYLYLYQSHCLVWLHSSKFTTPVTLFSRDLSHMLLPFLPSVLLHKVNRKAEGWELKYLLT